MSTHSPNTQAILLLTSELGLTTANRQVAPLTESGYRKLATALRTYGLQPSDLLGSDQQTALAACGAACDPDQVRRLIDRGLQLTQAMESWSSRAIWVISRADSAYPTELKQRLGDHAPPLLFGCGSIEVRTGVGLAVVGSRSADESMTEFTRTVAQQAAEQDITVISGGAKGVDQTSMQTALDHGGRVVGVLGDSLFRKSVDRSLRDPIAEGQLLLLSPFDPESRFVVWKAMSRNKVIYALANAGLVVNSDHKKGGTWNGALEQLTKFKSTPVYVRNTQTKALRALCDSGARVWPNAIHENLEDWIMKPPDDSESGTGVQGELFGS